MIAFTNHARASNANNRVATNDPHQPHPRPEPQLLSSLLDDPSFRQVLARVQQVSASRAAASAEYLNAENDVRAVLSLVQAPTLVLCGAPLPLVSSECVVSPAPCLAVFLQGWPAWRRNESRSRGSAR
jgi:hypothetical protein